MSELLDVIDRMKLGKPELRPSASSRDFAVWFDADAGEIRAVLLPGHWYHGASQADGRKMVYLKTLKKWLYISSGAQLREDIIATIRQSSGALDGSVREIRWDTLRSLVTEDEWTAAEVAVARLEAERLAG